MKIWAITVSVLLVGTVVAGVFFSLTLSSDLTAARADIETLEGEKATLEGSISDLETELAGTVATLIDTEIQLDETEAQLDATEGQLEVTESQLAATSSQLTAAQSQNNLMLNQYANLRAQINVRFGDTTQDIQSFITPDNPAVQAKVQEITGGFSSDVNEQWRDYERLYHWVVNNITYSYDSYMPVLPGTISGVLSWRGECWRTPEETLEDETGDCEDMALLLASMMLNYNEGRYFVWLVAISAPSGAHLAVALPVVDNQLAILDPAGNYYTGQYGSLHQESISLATNNWLSYWSSELPGAEIVQVFSKDIDEHFDDTNEFITWALD
jgi:hypothetical protein